MLPPRHIWELIPNYPQVFSVARFALHAGRIRHFPVWRVVVTNPIVLQLSHRSFVEQPSPDSPPNTQRKPLILKLYKIEQS